MAHSTAYDSLIHHILSGRRNIFLTGRAGTGKSFLIKTLQEEMDKLCAKLSKLPEVSQDSCP